MEKISILWLDDDFANDTTGFAERIDDIEKKEPKISITRVTDVGQLSEEIDKSSNYYPVVVLDVRGMQNADETDPNRKFNIELQFSVLV